MRPWPTLRPLSPSARDKMRRARSQSLRQPRPSPPSPRPPRRSAQPRRLRQRRPRGARRPPRHGLLRTCRARRCRRRAWAPARCRASRRRCPRCASGAQTLCYPTSGLCRPVPRLGARAAAVLRGRAGEALRATRALASPDVPLGATAWQRRHAQLRTRAGPWCSGMSAVGRPPKCACQRRARTVQRYASIVAPQVGASALGAAVALFLAAALALAWRWTGAYGPLAALPGVALGLAAALLALAGHLVLQHVLPLTAPLTRPAPQSIPALARSIVRPPSSGTAAVCWEVVKVTYHMAHASCYVASATSHLTHCMCACQTCRLQAALPERGVQGAGRALCTWGCARLQNAANKTLRGARQVTAHAVARLWAVKALHAVMDHAVGRPLFLVDFHCFAIPERCALPSARRLQGSMWRVLALGAVRDTEASELQLARAYQGAPEPGCGGQRWGEGRRRGACRALRLASVHAAKLPGGGCADAGRCGHCRKSLGAARALASTAWPRALTLMADAQAHQDARGDGGGRRALQGQGVCQQAQPGLLAARGADLGRERRHGAA